MECPLEEQNYTSRLSQLPSLAHISALNGATGNSTPTMEELKHPRVGVQRSPLLSWYPCDDVIKVIVAW